MGPFNRVALPGVALCLPLAQCPTAGFKGGPFKGADMAQLSVPMNSYEFGQEH